MKKSIFNTFILILLSFLFVLSCSNPEVISTSNTTSTIKNCRLTINIIHPDTADPITEYNAIFEKDGVDPVRVSSTTKTLQKELASGEWNLTIEAKSNTKVVLKVKTKLNLPKGSYTFYTSLIPVENLVNLTLNLRKEQNYVNLPSEPAYITKIIVKAEKSGNSITKEVNNFDTPIIFNEIEKGIWTFTAEAKDTNDVVYLKKNFNLTLESDFTYTDELPQIKVTPVKFSVDSGVIDNNTEVTLSNLTSNLGGSVEIYYSINNGTYQQYSTPITISGSANSVVSLKSYAKKSGLQDSVVVTKSYTIADPNTTSQPVINPNSGTYTSDIQVTITHSDSSADIFYTLDGSTPTTSSTKYTSPISISGDGTTRVVKAIAKSPSKSVSQVVTKNYTIDYPQLTLPTISPASGTYQSNQQFTITGEIGSEIRYTIDGTEPTTNSTLYSAPFNLPVGQRQIKARVYKSGYKPSNIKTESYTIEEAQFGGIRIYYYSTTTPKIWVWEDSGRAISQLMGHTWPGPDMTAVVGATNWWMFEIPESYAPFTKALKMHFNGNNTIAYTRNPPQTGWLKNDIWYNSNPDTGVTVSANPGSRSFTDTLTITLNVSNATQSKYTLDGTNPKTSGTAVNYTNGQTIVIGSGMSEGQTRTLKLWATNGTDEATETYTYTKSSISLGVIIYYYSTTANPTIWVWEDNGRAISQLMGYTWPGPEMTSIGYNWYKFEIPESFAPFTKALKMKFKGSDPEYTRNPPQTGWFKNGTWTDTCPDGPFPPSVSANPPGKNFSSNEITVTLNVNGDNITASKYTLDGTDPKTSGTATNYTNGQTIVIGSGMNINDTKTLKLWATNGTNEATANYTFKKVEKSNFSWDNATVYFVITDRFLDGNPSNNNSYGRQPDPEHQNIGTFHGGDLQGLTQKLNSNYFTDLGVNAIWITAPYEQIHGWVEGAGSSFKHYAYHGYYVLDYTKIDANMGTLSDLQTFIDTAHSKGIRVVFDIVMNHAGYPSIKDLDEYKIGVLKSGWENYSLGNYHTYIDYTSTNWVNWWGPDWVRAGLPGYTQPGGDDYTMCLAYLPDFKTESTQYVNLPNFYTKTNGKSDTNATYIPNFTVRKYITKWLTDWVRNYGVDGFRVDTAKHVEMDAWGYLKNEAKQALIDWRSANPSKPGANWTDDFWTVAEVWGHGVNQSNYHTSGAFDSVINFSYKGSIEGAMGSTSSMDSLFSGYANSINSSPSWNVLSYISSHDTGPVFYNGDDNRQIRAGTVFFLTPGGIQVFYGDELGRVNGPNGSDPDQGSRSSMNWGKENNSIHQHWKIMGQFRNRHISIGAGTHTKLKDSPYTFKREKDDDKVVVVIDASGPTTVNVSGIWPDGTQLRDYYTKATATVTSGNVTFTPGSRGVILIEKP